MRNINVLSLFDGMSCGQIALKEMGVKFGKYYAAEIDKYAIQQTQHNFPNSIQLGSVTDVDVTKLEPIDLLIGGSPCQSFSFAGKRNGMATSCSEEIYTLERYLELKKEGFEFEGESYLFWEYMRILTEIRKYNHHVLFLLENVEMGKKWERILSEAIGVFGVHINSALVSAQNRKRIYWTNIMTRQEGLFGEIHSDIPQPKDRCILLKDMLDDVVDKKYYLNEKMLKYFNNGGMHSDTGLICVDANGRESKEKTGTITSRYYKGVESFGGNPFIKEKGKVLQNLRIRRLTTGWCRNRFGDDFICVAMRGRNPNNPSDRTVGSPTEQRLEPNLSGKTNCLTSVQKDNLVFTKNYIQFDVSGKGYKSQQDRAFYEDGKHGALASSRGETKNGVAIRVPEATAKGYATINPGECVDLEHPNSKTRRGRKMDTKSNSLMSAQNSLARYTKDYKLRRLTPTECSRLQTIPEWYEWVVSDSQTYKMLGNGWTVEVIKHIFSYLDTIK